jgi:hypothetical protein
VGSVDDFGVTNKKKIIDGRGDVMMSCNTIYFDKYAYYCVVVVVCAVYKTDMRM